MTTNWKKHKPKVAFYCFGDSSRQLDIDNIVMEDAVLLLNSELDKLKENLSATANKTDPMLLQAIVFFACHLTVKAGRANERSGKVVSESMDGMSVSYESVGLEKITQRNQPKDFYSSAVDMINRYAEKYLPSRKTVPYAIANSRSGILDGLYDKYTDRFTHGI